MNNIIDTIEKLREELENLVALKGIGHMEVLKLSQKLDKYILIHYMNKILKKVGN